MTGQEAYAEDVLRSRQTDRPKWGQLTNEERKCWNERPEPRVWGDYWTPEGIKTWGVVGVPKYFG